ncbi:hypothetical protein FA13DRAFT_1736507 [Coprinellus micaceus]|uniref:Secreted protein n=1 Tax=Coprinellus micaceus TaxID=71717 RepID=A0A4Y7T0E0_COPMI|nr:hypothetical protein FA13DRAFT_1736507 [Coprinellus micaceus]
MVRGFSSIVSIFLPFSSLYGAKTSSHGSPYSGAQGIIRNNSTFQRVSQQLPSQPGCPFKFRSAMPLQLVNVRHPPRTPCLRNPSHEPELPKSQNPHQFFDSKLVPSAVIDS